MAFTSDSRRRLHRIARDAAKPISALVQIVLDRRARSDAHNELRNASEHLKKDIGIYDDWA